MFPNWAKNLLFLLVYMISGLVLVVIIEGIISGTDLLPLNTSVESVIAALRTPFLTTAMIWVSRAGDPFVLSSISLLVAVLLLTKKNIYDALLFLSALGLSLLSLNILRNVFQISRPVTTIYDSEGWSFPSGHATLATTFFFLICVTFLSKIKTLQNKILVVAGSIFGATLICFSRLYFGASWSLDILAGAALGILSVSFTVLVFNVFVSKRRSFRKSLNL